MKPHHVSRRSLIGLMGSVPLVALAGRPALAARTGPPTATLDARIQEVIARPEFQGSQWGLGFTRPGAGDYLYSLRPEQPFVAASAVKVFIGGAAFDVLGPRHRFRTRIVATGPVVDGTLHGDLILVAGGDLLLSARLHRDGRIDLPVPDHSYPGGPPLAGDPLWILRKLARDVRRCGIRRIAGHVRVDTSMFPETKETIASGAAPVTVSPMMLNDNIVNVTVTPGAAVGLPATIAANPATDYLTFTNEVSTVEVITQPLRLFDNRVTGQVAAGGAEQYLIYYVDDPGRYAKMVLEQEFEVAGGDAGGSFRRVVAEHVSPPVSEEVKVMLKVSSNLHTVMWPHVIGPEYADHRPPAPADGRYSTDTFVQYLHGVSRKPWFPALRDALPIMGRDGSLAEVQVGSPAAGHVFAKTGTGITRLSPTSNPVVYKALAGYVRLPRGGHLSFAQFMSADVATPAAANALATVAQEAMGEIATLVFEAVAR